jgi:metallo-beta-lactamase class B
MPQSVAAVPAAPTGAFSSKGVPTLLELGTDPMQRIGETVWVAEIAPKLWLHSTTGAIPGNHMFPANGLILERATGSLLIDTGYTPEQAELLFQWSKLTLSGAITTVVSTDFHVDRIGGVDALKKLGVRAMAHPLICQLAAEHDMPVPEPLRTFGTKPYRFASDCELYFPGPGHTRANIVAWLPDQQVLFGGCFLKSTTSADLGNLADAVVSDWPASVRRMHEQYPTPKTVIPGHGTMKGDAVAQTLALLADNNVKKTGV